MTPSPDAVTTAMRRAIDISRAAQGRSSPNPPVGAVVIADDGTIVGEGHTQAVGGPHAEVMALRAAGPAARGATAVVTLEPCNHTGRTGPCSDALIAAGVTAVHYAVDDPNPTASGGAQRLRDAGIAVHAGLLAEDARRGPLRGWLFRQHHGRPFVTAKIASTIDGRIAAPDGTSQWITGAAARAHAHEQRALLDVIIVGTGTVVSDDPSLTARTSNGELRSHQPTRVAMGHRDIPAAARIADAAAPFRHIRTHSPADVLDALDDALWVLVEGGPVIIGAFVAAGLVDEIDAYLAPAVLGAGQSSIDIPGVTGIGDARRFSLTGIRRLDDDVLVTLGADVVPTLGA